MIILCETRRTHADMMSGPKRDENMLPSFLVCIAISLRHVHAFTWTGVASIQSLSCFNPWFCGECDGSCDMSAYSMNQVMTRGLIAALHILDAMTP